MTYIDKNNLIPRLLEAGPLSIEIGVGQKKLNPFAIGIDIIDSPACDVIGDAMQVLSALPDSCVKSVYASHFIEHVEPVTKFINCLVRVCTVDALILIIAPHFSNPFFYSDPTHRSTYGLYTFNYYAISTTFRRTIPSYSRVGGLVLVDVLLRFNSYPPNYIRHVFKKIIQKIVNSSSWSKELYEESLCWLLPCYDIQYTLTINK
jgi:predicted SAM-dependent methyltransferase